MDISKHTVDRHVVVLGMNHSSSQSELRDKILFPESKIEAGLSGLLAVPSVREAAILSTCNRMEIYAVVLDPDSARMELIEFISHFHGVPVSDIESHIYYSHCYKAVEHLYHVTSSLDSMVVGEYQILGQVKEAYRLACHHNSTGTVLNKLFHFAMAAGKRVRTETKIGDGVVSISSVAVQLAEKILGKLDRRIAMIIGAGEMSELTARHLTASGIKKIYFVNRTRERAMEMASEFGGTPLALGKHDALMAECDIVISSTGAPHYIIRPEEIHRVMTHRRNRAIFLIDIAAPRDIDPQVGNISNVFLYTIDDLTMVSEGNAKKRIHEIGDAKRILSEERDKYFDWYNSLKVMPTLLTFRKEMEELRDREMKRYSSQLAAMPEEHREVLRQFARSLTIKFLHSPSKVLKEKATSEEGLAFADTVVDLFNLKIGKDE